MDDENLFETNLADSAWQWDFIDFWAQPLSQRGMKLGKEKDDKVPSPEKDQCPVLFLKNDQDLLPRLFLEKRITQD